MADSDNDAQPPTTSNDNNFQADTFRILIATDNHIGVNERDPVRSQDSINTFKEILQLAAKHEVDLILLGGDLFHENKPTRDSLYQTTALLRQYTLGEKPVQFELLSDPNEGKPAGYPFPAINYEDPNYNISIPVFSIHGNHDDPQGVGAEGALCALDLLSVSGLINYMGKFDLPAENADAASTGIAVRPVLLRKGQTHLGLYGIGNVKDQRMHYELRSNRVRMYMPADKQDWFNILLVHQNRARRGPQEYVPEGMFDDSIDLVIWGHEHDCRITPEPVADKEYHIVQPGSSVATSLADGEAIEKHVGLLEVQGKDYNLTPISLRTVRPFVLDSVVLADIAEDEGLDITSSIEITKYLKQRVAILIEQANASWDERNARAVEAGEEELPPMLPIIRLKVDTTGVSEMTNPVRFGQEYAGRIANPRELLIFHRSKKIVRSGKVNIDQPELSLDDPDLTNSEKLAKIRVGSLVKEYLAAQELQLLGETGMSDAIQTFVEKDDLRAIQSHVAATLGELLQTVKPGDDVEEQELEDLLTKAKERHEEEYVTKARTKSSKKGKAPARDEDSDAASVDSLAMDVDGGGDFQEDSDDEPPPPPKKRAPAKKAAAPKKAPAKKAAPAKGKGKKAVQQSDSDIEEIEIPEDDEVYSDDEPPPPKTTKKTNRAAVLSQSTTAKKAPAKKTPAKKQATLSFAPAAGRSQRTAATKARGRMVESDDSG